MVPTARERKVDKLLGVHSLEERTEVSRHTWRRWISEGRLPCIRLGRRVLVSEAALADFLAAHRRPAR